MKVQLTLVAEIQHRMYCGRSTYKGGGCLHLNATFNHCSFWDEPLQVTKIGTYERTCRTLKCVDFEVAVGKEERRNKYR